MKIVLIILLIILIGVIIYLVAQLTQENAYYAYKSDKLNRMEESSTQKIKELEKSVEHLSEAAYTDITTKIGNRDYFIKRMVEVLGRDQSENFTLIGFGISNIAMVNRMYGPAEGDRLVRFAAQTLKQNLRKGSVYALVQSNLFAVLLKSQKEEEIQAVVSDITEQMEKCSDIFTVEVAFGIYLISD